MRCVWCHHRVRVDLRGAFDGQGCWIIECADASACDLRAVAAGLALGLHVEAIR